MFRRRVAISLVLLLLTAFILTGPAYAAAALLTAPAGAAVSAEGTQFKIKWQNPSDVCQTAKSAYDSYNGALYYIVDWRVNKGAWHYDREAPGEQDFLSYYPNIHFQFFGRLCDGLGDINVPQTIIDKVMVGVPYDIPVGEWLKKNSVEFRIRYVYEYWNEVLMRAENRYSAFSNIVSLGNSSPTGSLEPSPITGEFGMPVPPPAIEGPKELVSEYMTLNLSWKVPEIIKTLNDMEMWPVEAVLDWKLNNGEWHDGMKGLTDPNYVEFTWSAENLIPDKDGYASVTLSRRSLQVTPGMPLSSWLADKTYYFRVRYVFFNPQEKGAGYIVSPYSNTVNLGRGTVPPKPAVNKR